MSRRNQILCEHTDRKKRYNKEIVHHPRHNAAPHRYHGAARVFETVFVNVSGLLLLLSLVAGAGAGAGAVGCCWLLLATAGYWPLLVLFAACCLLGLVLLVPTLSVKICDRARQGVRRCILLGPDTPRGVLEDVLQVDASDKLAVCHTDETFSASETEEAKQGKRARNNPGRNCSGLDACWNRDIPYVYVYSCILIICTHAIECTSIRKYVYRAALNFLHPRDCYELVLNICRCDCTGPPAPV